MELNANEIIKALEHCTSGGNCSDCLMNDKYPRYSQTGCMSKQMYDALSLINELTEENERLLKALNTDISIVRVSRGSGKTAYLREVGRIKVDAIKADTVREMQEKLTKEFDRMHKSDFITVEVRQWIIDQIAKEMIGDE